jgi:hypothetical protein
MVIQIDRDALYAQWYQITTRSQPDDVLEGRVKEFEEFKQLPLKTRVVKHLTLRAPDWEGYQMATQELDVRAGKAEPQWFVKRYLDRNCTT